MSIIRHLAWPLSLLLWTAPSARADEHTDFEADRDPEIRVPAPIQAFTKQVKPLWLQALARPESDLQRMAADAFGRARLAGMPDLDEAIPPLVRVLTSSSSHPAARLAAAQALVKFQAKDVAPQMAASAEQYGADLRQIIEPALAAWNYEPQQAIWQTRLTTTGVHTRDLVLASRCLVITGEASQAGALHAIVHDRFRPSAVRSEAARAAGLLQNQGLEADARRLTAESAAPPLVNRLCAVRLLAGHDGDEAQPLLESLASDAEPAVAAVALARLLKIAPVRALLLAPHAIASADPIVREQGILIYRRTPDPERVAALARLLDDPHPIVRGSARETLAVLAERPELKDAVRRGATEMLAGDNWRGLEQAALLLAALDHKPAAPRLVELLEFGRAEVNIAAAWGLKTLAVPETLPALLDKARRQDELRRTTESESASLDEQTAHLFEAFGRMKYGTAEPLLLEYVPKNFKIGQQSRKSAIWALGLLHAGVPDEPLARQLMERVVDQGGVGHPAERVPIKEISAVSIARMHAISQASKLRGYVEPETPPNRLGMTIRWALMELTGEPIPEPTGALLP
ncbi:MAG TPA: HEAT repeat domain-containing protein, partial [Planctomycetaceae bacterium]|nr:HEAT repeat domain-containing protein [Planctomycetaceae bacterium]